jgi:hypothetical protein
VRPLFATAHHLFDQTHDQHDNRATGATSGDLTEDGAKVESTSGRARQGRDSHAKQLPTDAAAYDAGNGISDRAQTEVLEESAHDVTADRAAYELNDQCQDTHDFS